jgi:8-oxo-dGTP pyrophosphatase MutT (NUDIX family)
VLAADTGRVLFAQRSPEVNEPGTWGVWGGAIEPGEDPAKAAVREVREETGYRGRHEPLVPLYVFQSGSFVYRNYLLIVPEEFQPRLNWESSGAVWLPLEEAPHPRHYGLAALLADEATVRILAAARRGRRQNPIVDETLYHVTFYGRLQGILEDGLVAGSGATFSTHAGYARGWIFLTDEDGLRGWFHKMHAMAEHESDNPVEDGWVPVVLRVRAGAVDAEDDPEGSRDVPEGQSYRTRAPIAPEDLEVWDGRAWSALDEWENIDPELGVTREVDDGGDLEFIEPVNLVWVDDADTSDLFPAELWREADWGPRRPRL